MSGSWALGLVCIVLFGPAARSQAVNERIVVIPIIEANDISFTRLAADSGLSQDRVSQIVQDDQGFMWFGTQYGLNRFDGYQFKVFSHDPKSQQSLGGVYVRALFKSADGFLWVGCDQSLDRFDPVTESFMHYRIVSSDPSVRDVTVRAIGDTGSGKLWLATDDGLYEFDSATGRSKAIGHDEKDLYHLSNLKPDTSAGKAVVWVSNTAGIEALDRSTGQPTRELAFPDIHDVTMYEDRRGLFWLFNASGNGLATYDRRTGTLTRYRLTENNAVSTAKLGISSAIEDTDGTLWFGTNGAGLLKWDPENDRILRYRNYAGDLHSIAADTIVTMFQDSEGNIWTGLHGTQANVFPSKPRKFDKLNYGPPSAQSRGGTLVNAIHKDSSGQLWLSFVGMLERVDQKTGHLGLTASNGSAIADIITIAEDSRRGIWLGTVGDGLTRINLDDDTFQRYQHDSTKPFSISSNLIARLKFDRYGTLWVAASNAIHRYDESTNRFYAYRRPGVRPYERYQSIADDASGVLWLGSTVAGLQSYDPSTGKFHVFIHDADQSDSLSNDRVNSVLVDSAGRVWSGTQDGLDLLDQKTGAFKAYYDSEGLGGNVVSCILEDDRGMLWMSTNKGISRFDPKSGHFANYSMADGLPGSDLSGWGSCDKGTDGEMLFGGYAGAIAFFPERITDSVTHANTLFTELDVAGVSMGIGNGSPLSKSIGYTDSVTLSHLNSSFSVWFSTLSFINAKASEYRYRLDGLDSTWQIVSSERRMASFTSLAPGNYRLSVQSSIGGGPWSEPASLRVHITPPWWGTWWFRGATAAIASLLLLTIYIVRLRQLKLQIGRDLDLRHAERARIARELHDTLMQTVQVSKLVADGFKDLDLPAAVRQPVEKLSFWLGKAIEEGRAALDSLRGLAAPEGALADSLRATAEECAPVTMTVTLEEVGRSKHLQAGVRDEIYRIISEAVRNACMHSDASQFAMRFEYGRDLTIRVDDNGCGFDARLVDAGRPGHFGLAGMKERSVKIGAHLSVRTRVGEGTTLELTVPGRIAYIDRKGR